METAGDKIRFPKDGVASATDSCKVESGSCGLD